MYTLIAETYGEELEIAFRLRNKYRDTADEMVLKNDWMLTLTEEQALENTAYTEEESPLRSFIYFKKNTIKETLDLASKLAERIEEDFLAISLQREEDESYSRTATLYSYNYDGLMDRGESPFDITDYLKEGLEEVD